MNEQCLAVVSKSVIMAILFILPVNVALCSEHSPKVNDKDLIEFGKPKTSLGKKCFLIRALKIGTNIGFWTAKKQVL